MGGIGRRLGTLMDDLSTKVLGGGTSNIDSDYEKAVQLSLVDSASMSSLLFLDVIVDVYLDPSTSSAQHLDEKAQLETAIRLSLQSDEKEAVNEVEVLVLSVGP